ncbi:DNA/RNA non-specific endonuclease [Actinomadura miaoliensis]|uniref:DNA/RNA non-specific endonuclease n=1 Tax=Actinomadura miaoliensis TaxID=430685 RepID=UPI003CD09A7A
MSRPERAEATDLIDLPTDRGPCQGEVGHMAATSGYDGGHLIAATLHGVDRRYDLVPQWHSINRGIYMRWEEGAKRCLRAPGGRVRRYAVRIEYPAGDSVRPVRHPHDRGHPRPRTAVVRAGHPQPRPRAGGFAATWTTACVPPAAPRPRRSARPPPTGCRSWRCLRAAWQEHLVVPRAPSRVHGRG